MNELIKFKEKMISLVSSPINDAKHTALNLFKDGKISEQDYNTILAGLQKVNINNIHFTIDNHVDVNATHWGNIATGNSTVEDYFKGR